jgi:hypothetical protein
VVGLVAVDAVRPVGKGAKVLVSVARQPMRIHDA